MDLLRDVMLAVMKEKQMVYSMELNLEDLKDKEMGIVLDKLMVATKAFLKELSLET
jgi:hypothetical protein